METVSIPKSQAENIFKFSEPLAIINPSVDFENVSKNEAFYKFSQPLDVLTGKTIAGAATSLDTPPANNSMLTGFGNQFKRSRKEWECNDCMVYNTPELENCVACKAPRKATTLTLDSSFGQQFKKSADKWECETCMIQNTQEKTKCIACEAPRRRSCKFDEGFKTLASQQKASKWECSACMTQNDNNCSKCVCCEQGKPGHTKKPEETTQSSAVSGFTFGFGNGTNGPTESDLRKASTSETAPKPATEFKFGFANTNTTPSDAGFKALASQQKASKWECTACMTQNENKSDNCVCCGQQKPGQEAKEKLSRVAVTPTFTFGFGIVNNVGKTTTSQQGSFQFGPQKHEAMSWECGTCLVRNKPESTKCVCCKSVRQNDSTEKTPTCTISKETETTTTKFKFGFGNSNTTPVVADFKTLASQQKASKWECSTCMTQNDTNKVKCVCCDEAKPGAERSSGNSKPLETVTATNFRFGFFPETKASTEELDCKTSQVKKLTATPADDEFKALAAQQKASKWECDACMTQNDTTLVKCACCEQVKPGEKVEVKTSLQNEVAAPKFRFGFGDGNNAPTEEELRKKL